jgi:hypothetical protein
MAEKAHLIGAYGMLWDRQAVAWNPGSGPQAWQMLGYVNTNRPALRVCDFRQARGFYILFDEFRATYAGLARGKGGIGARLRTHHNSDKRWSRFCWFSLDGVRDVTREWPGWSEVKDRDAVRSMTPETVIRESEALMIAILGLQDQNEMRFLQAQRWNQLTDADFARGGVGLKVDRGGYTDEHFRWLFDGD